MELEYRGGVVVLDDGSDTVSDLLERAAEVFPHVHRMTADPLPQASENVIAVGRKRLNVKSAVQQMHRQRCYWALVPNNQDPVVVIADFIATARPLLAAGFPAFVLVNGQPSRRYRRVALVADTHSPVTTGSLFLAAVGLASRANATLDVLILGGDPDHPPRSSDEVRQMFSIREEAELLEEAVSKTHELGVAIRWIPLGESTIRDQLVLDAVRDGEYDVVLDDLRMIDVGPRLGRVRRVRKQLFEGGSIDTAYRLMRDAPCDVAIVVDAVRMQLVPGNYIKAGAIAALSLGVIGAASAPVTASASAAETTVAVEAPLDPTAEPEPMAVPSDADLVGTPPPPVEALPEQVTADQMDALHADYEAQQAALEEEQQQLEALAAQGESAEQEVSSAQEVVDTEQEQVADAEAALASAQAAYEHAVESNDIYESEEMLRLGDVNKAEADLDAAEAELAEAEAQLAEVQSDTAPAVEAVEAQQQVVESQTANLEAWDDVVEVADERAPEVVSPCPGYTVTTHYGVAGELWASGHHTGTDFAAPIGTEVDAVSGGEVIFAGENGPYGNQVQIEHDDGTVTTYSHLDEIEVTAGEEVEAGEQIGTVGNTGNSTGPHLHFEVHDASGATLDSDAWLDANGVETHGDAD